MSVYTKDHKHDAIQLIVKRIKQFQGEGRQWLASAYIEALDRLLDKDDGESAAEAINYILGFEKYCCAFLDMRTHHFDPPRKGQ